MGSITAIVRAAWREFTENPRLYALFFAGPFTLVAFVWLAHVVAQPRWEQPLEQLDILKAAITLTGFTHMIVVIALAMVRVSGRGPGGFQFDVSSDDDDHSSTQRVTVQGEVDVTKVEDTGELPPDKRLP